MKATDWCARRDEFDMPKKDSARSNKPAWKKAAPKTSHHSTLTPQSKARAKAAAKKAGRPYPSLVDNMNAAKKQRRGGAKAKTASPKQSRKS
jgi:hypothetical protein